MAHSDVREFNLIAHTPITLHITQPDKLLPDKNSNSGPRRPVSQPCPSMQGSQQLVAMTTKLLQAGSVKQSTNSKASNVQLRMTHHNTKSKQIC